MISKNLISGLWYHGDLEKYDTFKDRYLDSEDFTRDRNAVGPGIYFTRLKWQAAGYAESKTGEPGYIYTVTMDLDPKRVLDKKTKPDEQKLKQFIELAPDKEHRDMCLQDWAENIEVAKRKIVASYMDYSDELLDATTGLYKDLYGRDSRAFGKAMTAIGYDAYLHKLPEVYHLIVYNPDIIQFKSVEKKLKNIKMYEDFSSDI